VAEEPLPIVGPRVHSTTPILAAAAAARRAGPRRGGVRSASCYGVVDAIGIGGTLLTIALCVIGHAYILLEAGHSELATTRLAGTTRWLILGCPMQCKAVRPGRRHEIRHLAKRDSPFGGGVLALPSYSNLPAFFLFSSLSFILAAPNRWYNGAHCHAGPQGFIGDA
jgi:hypothetical protein